MKIPRQQILLCVFFALALPAFAGPPKVKTFDGTVDQVFDAAVKTAQKDWSVTFADRKLAMLSFNTGTSFTSNGMECSASLKDLGNGKVEISLKTQKKNGQIVGWGVGGRIADKFFKGIEEQLKVETPRTDAAASK